MYPWIASPYCNSSTLAHQEIIVYSEMDESKQNNELQIQGSTHLTLQPLITVLLCVFRYFTCMTTNPLKGTGITQAKIKNLQSCIILLPFWCICAKVSKTRQRRLLFWTHFTAHSAIHQLQKEMRVDGFMPHWCIIVTSSWKMFLGP